MTDWLMVGAAVITGMGYLNKSDLNYKVASASSAEIAKKVDEKFADDISAAETKLDLSKAKLEVFNRAEQKECRDRLDMSDAYKDASTAATAAKAKIDVLKKAIKQAQGNQTKVALGNGDNAIAINLTNNDAKAKLEAELAEAEATHKANVDICNTIKSRIMSDIRSGRGDDYFAANAKVKEAEAELNSVAEKANNYRAELAKNPKYGFSAVKDNWSEVKIIGSAAAKSALPAYILYKIWRQACDDLNVLKEAKRLLG